MKRICTLISIALVALVGCGGSDSVSSDDEVTTEYASRSIASAIGHNWVLKSFVSGDKVVDVIEGSEATLKLDTDGRVFGTTGCNHYGGSYTVVDSFNLSFGAVAATEMACMGDGIMDQESRFLRSLTSVSSMELRDEELRFYLERASEYLVFAAAADDSSQDGTAHPDSAITDSTVYNPPETPDVQEDTVRVGDYVMRYAIFPCAKSETPTRSGPKIDVVVGGNDLYFHAELMTYCNAQTDRALSMVPVIDGNQITLNAVFRGPAVRCMCTIPVRGVVEGLTPGTYTLTLVYGVELPDGTHMEPEVLHQIDVTVGTDPAVEPGTEPEPLPADLRLTASDSGDTIELDRPGAIVEIALESNPSTGYSWQIINGDSTTLMLVRELFESGEEGLQGEPGVQRLFFEAQAPGTTHLKLGYMRVWESLPPLQTFDIGFIVNGGIVPPPIPPLGIRIGTSFGECGGYCWKEVLLDEEAIVVIARSWDTEAYPEKVYEEKMKPELWVQLQTTADFSTLEQMDEVYGCPDCDDGGAEWVTMTLSGRIETVKFEYGAKLEPLAELLELLRAVRNEVIERSGL
jgi:heat shock protein HslJ/predicted secreted protein